MTHADLISLLGGYLMVAKALGCNPRSVHNWTRPRRGIPSAYWPQIIRMADKRRISLADVERNPMERPPRASRLGTGRPLRRAPASAAV